MKKTLVLIMLLILTGCGKKNDCDYKFKGEMTDKYSDDVNQCETVTYTDKVNDIEIVTSPKEDGKKFTADITYKNSKIFNMFEQLEFKNIKTYQRGKYIFIEMFKDEYIISLIVMDIDGNVIESLNNVLSPVFNNNTFSIEAPLLPLKDGKYLCDEYDHDSFAYRKFTYNINNVLDYKEEEVKLGKVCK